MLKEVIAEIVGMFTGDWRLTLAILAVVATVAAAITLAGLDPLIGGALLLFACVALLIDNVRRSAVASR